MRFLPSAFVLIMVLAGCRLSPSQPQAVPEPVPTPPPTESTRPRWAEGRTNIYRQRWMELTPEERAARRQRVRDRMEVNPAIEGKMVMVGVIISTNHCRLSYKSVVEGRAKADGSYTQKGIMYTAYNEAGRPVFRGFMPDPRIVEVEGDGRIHTLEIPEGDATLRLPYGSVRVVFRKWDRPVRGTGVPPMPPSQNVIGEIDL